MLKNTGEEAEVLAKTEINPENSTKIKKVEKIFNKEQEAITACEEFTVEELYVKYKNYSYLHCEWKTVEELEELGEKRALAKLNR